MAKRNFNFVILTKKQFKDFYLGHPLASFMQTLELAELKLTMGNDIYFLGVEENNKVVAATLILGEKLFYKYKTFYAPRGFLIDYHDKDLLSYFTEQLKSFVREHNGFKIVIDPNLVYLVRNSDGSVIDGNYPDVVSFDNLLSLGYKHFGFNLYLEARQVRFAYRMLLDDDYEKKKQFFSKSTRKNIELSTKNGIVVRVGDVNDLESMEELFADTAMRKDFFYRTLDYYKLMYKYMKDLMTIYFAHLDPDLYLKSVVDNLKGEEEKNKEIINKMKVDKVGKKLLDQKAMSDNRIKKLNQELLEAKKFKEENPLGKDIACLLSMKSGDEYLTLTSGSLENYRKFIPKYAMYDRHIKDAYKMGYKSCNFYGIAGNFKKENNPLYGVYEFKRGFSGNVIEYIGEFELGVNFLYLLYVFLRKIKNLLKK